MSAISDTLLDEESSKEVEDGTWMLPFVIAMFVVMAALFIGEMLFGKNSLEVYLALQKDQSQLEKKIKRIQAQNAALQKEYFELKSVMPAKDDE